MTNISESIADLAIDSWQILKSDWRSLIVGGWVLTFQRGRLEWINPDTSSRKAPWWGTLHDPF